MLLLTVNITKSYKVRNLLHYRRNSRHFFKPGAWRMPITFLRSEWQCKNTKTLKLLFANWAQKYSHFCAQSGSNVCGVLWKLSAKTLTRGSFCLSYKISTLLCLLGLFRPAATKCLLMITVLNLVMLCVR